MFTLCLIQALSGSFVQNYGLVRYLHDPRFLLKQIRKASRVHKQLKANKRHCKAYENGDLVSQVYLKAYERVRRNRRGLKFQEVKHLCRLAGFQAYREHLPRFCSHYDLEELENMGTLVGFPEAYTATDEVSTPTQRKLRVALGLPPEPA